MPESIPAPLVIDTLRDTFREARRGPGPPGGPAAIAAGLWRGGEPVVLMIQHAGLYASVNTLRGVALDGRVPIFYMIGLLSRERDNDPRHSPPPMVRSAEPLLAPFGVPHARLEGPDDVRLIPEYYRLSRARRGPAAVLVGLGTI